MTTRPGFIWSGSEWVAIGQEAVVAPVSYQTSAPSTPSTGDIWIDSNDDVPGIDTSQFLRWRKTMAGGETSVSGTDDNGLTLAYTANYEQVYLNGVLLVRGQDYTATNGTSITGLTALAANDVVEVYGVVARVVGDVYTQAQSDSKYSPITTTGLVLVSSTVFTTASTVNINNCFTSTYDNYRIVLEHKGSAVQQISMRMRVGGTDNSSANYWNNRVFSQASAVSSSGPTSADTSFLMTTEYETGVSSVSYDIYSPFKTYETSIAGIGQFRYTSFYQHSFYKTGQMTVTTSYDGFSLISGNGTMTGTIKVYGYK